MLSVHGLIVDGCHEGGATQHSCVPAAQLGLAVRAAARSLAASRPEIAALAALLSLNWAMQMPTGVGICTL